MPSSKKRKGAASTTPMDNHRLPFDGPPPPLISLSELELREKAIHQVDYIRKQLFLIETVWEDWAQKATAKQDVVGSSSSSEMPPEHSPYYNWYLRVASGETAVRTDIADGRIPNGRLIAWNPKKPWQPSSLFFRSLDTCRLLPMDCAEFRIETYTNKGMWQYLEERGRINAESENQMDFEGWQVGTLLMIMHEILIARNFHDMGGSDIPMILMKWTEIQLDVACNYWVELSKGEWDEPTRLQKYNHIRHYMQGSSPCFYQVDLLLRALVHDPKVEYVPPFIVLYSIQGDVKARFVFSRPEFFPPKSLIDDFPNTCNAPACKETNCSSVDWKKCVSLAKDSKLVRANIYPQGVACNFWPCNMREPRGDTVKTSFLKCAKCKDVLYCSSVCQRADWGQHKQICQKPPGL